MKKLLLLLCIAFGVGSCKKENSLAMEDPDWIRLEIPTGQEAYAIAGDVDKTLLVTTWTKAYYSTDRGKTWQESKNFQGPVPGLLVRNDTVFALKASGRNNEGQRFATMTTYCTIDYGVSWRSCAEYFPTPAGYAFYSDLVQPIGIAQTSTGISYRIKENLTPLSSGSNSSHINPSEIRREDNYGQQTVRFPFKHNLLNLYLDSSNHLYVAASGSTFVEQTNGFYCCDDKMPAIVYVSKKPLP